MGIFSEVVTPGNDDRDPPFPEVEATYLVELESVRYLDGTGPSGNKAFIPNFAVLESSTDQVELGSFRAKYMSLNGNEFPKAIVVQRKELTTFLCAMVGFDPDTVAGQTAFAAAYPTAAAQNALFDAAVAGEMNGRKLKLRTTLKKKSAKARTPGNFTVHAWAPGEDPAGAAPAAPKAPPAPKRETYANPSMHAWPRSEDGRYAWEDATQTWYDVATGQPA